MFRTLLRVIVKFFRFSAAITGAVLDYRKNVQKKGLENDYWVKAMWLKKWCAETLKSLDVHCTCEGIPPTCGMLASTHVSYVDVLVIGAHIPTVFVAKSQVRKWPIVGYVTSLAGTLYVSREHKGDVKRIADEFRPVIEKGLVAVVFPEGTSTNSHEVRPFYSSLFAPAVDGHFPVTSAWVGYTVPKPYKTESHVCFWGDMGFATHLIRMLSVPRIEAKLVFGKRIENPTDRKLVAKELHEDAMCIASKEGRLQLSQE